MILPGHNPLLLGPDVGAYTPASFVFNGTDEYLQRVIASTSPTVQLVTLSCWAKVPPVGFKTGSFIAVYASPSDRECWFWVVDDVEPEFSFVGWDDPDGADFFDGFEIDDNTWKHWVIRFDSTQAAFGNRVRLYMDGIPVGNFDDGPPLNYAFRWFKNGLTCWIGNSYCGEETIGKMAFVDVIQGQSLAPTAFAFDDSGTWTRMPYAGPYGNYGFSLDGTDGFNDVSGNGQNFTGLNMTPGANLDAGDLPPFISS